MKPPAAVSRRIRPALFALVIMLAPPVLPAEDATPKNHSIFVGLDITVEWKGKLRPLIGVDKNNVRILADNKETVVPKVLARDIRVKQGVKLSNLGASVANLHGTEGSNHAANLEAIAQLQDGLAQRDAVAYQRDRTMWENSVTSNAPPSALPGAPAQVTPAPESTVAGLDDKMRNLERTNMDRLSGSFGTGPSLAAGGLNVTFEVSAPSPLEQCYAAVVASYTLPGDARKAFNRISLQALGTVGPNPRKVSFDVRGFPGGAVLKSYRLCLYSGGVEVATNISPRRTDVTRDEAVVFLTSEYLSKHKGETRPPVPILMVSPLEFAAQLGSASREQVIYARVGPDGKLIRLSTDAAGSARLPVDLSWAIEQIAFVPALEKGRPVEGVARLKLADLVASN